MPCGEWPGGHAPSATRRPLVPKHTCSPVGKIRTHRANFVKGLSRNPWKQALVAASDPRLDQTGVTNFTSLAEAICEAFDGVEDGVLAAFGDGVVRLERMIADASSRERGWRERVRAGLVAALQFLDSEPDWARFLLLEPHVATGTVAEHRRQALCALTAALERETRLATGSRRSLACSHVLTAELVVGGMLAALRGQLLAHPERSLAGLAPALMSFVSTSYATVDAGLHVGLPVRATYRTMRVLSAIAERPHSNNREIADAAGLRDEGQTSKLLSRLEQRGVIENVGLGAVYGEPNEWLLTRAGARLLSTARGLSAGEPCRARRGRAAGGVA